MAEIAKLFLYIITIPELRTGTHTTCGAEVQTKHAENKQLNEYRLQ